MGGGSSPKTTVTLERILTDWHVGYFHDGVYTDEVASSMTMTIEVDLGTVLSVYGPSNSSTLSSSVTGDLVKLDESELWHHHFLAFRAIGSSSIFFNSVVAP